MPTVTSTDDVELTVHEFGPEDGERVLFCHANGFHGFVWRHVAEHLPGVRAIALDFRGFGSSTEGSAPPRWDGFGEDVLAVIDHYDLRDVRGVGHSMGGAALFMAELARPGVMASLVCFEPIAFPPVPDRTGPNPLAELTRRRRETFPSRDDAVANYRTKATLGALAPEVLDDYVSHGFVDRADGSIELAARREWEAAAYDLAPEHGVFGRLDGVHCPVLVVRGRDEEGPARIAPLIVERLPLAELVEEARLGHFGPLEDPAWFAAVVAERFAKLSDPPA